VRIIEDDPSVQMFLSRLVELAGFVTINYGSAEQFMSDDNLAQPGCVLIDLMLPGLNGADLVHWIGQQVQHENSILHTPPDQLENHDANSL